MVDQPAEVTQMISIVMPSWIDTISVNNFVRQIRQARHNGGFKEHMKFGKLVGGNTHTQIVGSNRLSRFMVETRMCQPRVRFGTSVRQS